ncbi:MAG: hypothetical protein V1827_01350 [Candidatus Micrarchaeota archaeon]
MGSDGTHSPLRRRDDASPSARKGQVSVEFLLILAVSITIITIVAILAQEQMGAVQRQKDSADTQNSLLDLSSAAREVYSQGEGSKKLVFVRLPSGYEPDRSFVANKSIQIRVAGTDHVSLEDFNVRGQLPGSSGGQWVWVISEGNRVRIGTAMLGLSRNSIFVLMDQNDSASVSFDAESLWDSDISVNTSMYWPHTEVGATPSEGDFQLSPNGSRSITIDFSTSSSLPGYYVGEMVFDASDGNASETVELPITVQVMGYAFDESPPMNVSPDIWAENLDLGNGTSKIFSVCTNQHTSLTGVSFTPSPGAPGSWVNGTEPLGPMGAGTCQMKTLFLTVPLNASYGTYSGMIDVTGQGAAGAGDFISVIITVQNESGDTCVFSLDNQSMCNCPVGAQYWEVPLCQCQPANIYVLNGTIVGGDWDGLPYNGTLVGGSTSSIISGTEGDDIIYSGTSGDKICGQEGNDTLWGGNGVDMLDGGMGADTIYGGAAEDRLYGKEGNDLIYGEGGADQIDGGGNDDTIYGGIQVDLIYGGEGNDWIDGGDNDDILCGNSGDDVIFGGENKDDLDGGTGTNTLDGGSDSNDCYNGDMVNCTYNPGYHPTCGPT